jgi:hypothetical protein
MHLNLARPNVTSLQALSAPVTFGLVGRPNVPSSGDG